MNNRIIYTTFASLLVLTLNLLWLSSGFSEPATRFNHKLRLNPALGEYPDTEDQITRDELVELLKDVPGTHKMVLRIGAESVGISGIRSAGDRATAIYCDGLLVNKVPLKVYHIKRDEFGHKGY